MTNFGYYLIDTYMYKGDKLRLCVFLAATSPKVARRIKVFGYLVKNAKYSAGQIRLQSYLVVVYVRIL